MRLTQPQLLSIALRVLPPGPCRCGGGTHRIEPELRDLSPMGLVVIVMCLGCARLEFFSAAVLGLVPAPENWGTAPAAPEGRAGN
jgi:hypothetical protein